MKAVTELVAELADGVRGASAARRLGRVMPALSGIQLCMYDARRDGPASNIDDA